MDRYASFPNFQCSVDAETISNSKKVGSQMRSFRYETPNRFRVESKGQDGTIIDAISDGKQEQDYDNLKLANSTFNGAAPAKLSGATSADMLDPSLCGSPVYGFFGGSANFDHLVKGAVKWVGTGPTQNNEDARIVHFDTPGLIGNVKAVIGEKSGYVYQLTYDLSGAREGLQKKLATMDPKMMAAQKPAIDRLLNTQFGELYMNIRVGEPLSRNAFDPNFPGASALAAIDLTKQGDASPLPLNEPAPALHLTGMDGKSVTLDQFKGHPVMIDFWATWCAPCRAGLPDTADAQSRGAKSGLVVLAVSDEDAATINTFLTKQKYKLTAVRDPGDQAQKAYQVGGLPSQVFINAKGVLVKYLIGYHPPSDVHQALVAAGVNL